MGVIINKKSTTTDARLQGIWKPWRNGRSYDRCDYTQRSATLSGSVIINTRRDRLNTSSTGIHSKWWIVESTSEWTSAMTCLAHVVAMAAKASKTLGFLRRNLVIRESTKEVEETAYTALVRPTLDYASPAWDPSTSEDVTKTGENPKPSRSFCS